MQGVAKKQNNNQYFPMWILATRILPCWSTSKEVPIHVKRGTVISENEFLNLVNANNRVESLAKPSLNMILNWRSHLPAPCLFCIWQPLTSCLAVMEQPTILSWGHP